MYVELLYAVSTLAVAGCCCWSVWLAWLATHIHILYKRVRRRQRRRQRSYKIWKSAARIVCYVRVCMCMFVRVSPLCCSQQQQQQQQREGWCCMCLMFVLNMRTHAPHRWRTRARVVAATVTTVSSFGATRDQLCRCVCVCVCVCSSSVLVCAPNAQ